MLLFGDENGTVHMCDRNLNTVWKQRVYRGVVKGVAYIYDNGNHRRQFIICVGDDQAKAGDSIVLNYVIKVT